MTTPIGRNVRIEIGTTEGSAVTVSAVTVANPGVATATAHGLSTKSAGYFSGVSGMVQLEGQAARLGTVATNTFELTDIETTDYAAFTGTCSFFPVTAWSTLGRITGYDSGGGEGEKLDDTVLLDIVKQEVQGINAAQTVTMNLSAMTISDAAMTALRRAARRATYLVFRVTLHDGSVRIFRGQPSLPGESIQKGALGTGSFTVTVKGLIIEGAA